MSTTNDTIQFGDISIKDTPNNLHVYNTNTDNKYLDIDKTNGMVQIDGGISIGSKFNKIVISKGDGVYIPNCAHFKYNGGNIANGKISWDKNGIMFNDNIIPLSALKSSELDRFIEKHIGKVNNSNSSKKGDKGERGINGEDGYSIITLLDSFYIITDESNICLNDTNVIIPIKVMCGNRACGVSITNIDTPKGFDISTSNNGDYCIISISNKFGSVIDEPYGIIKYDITVDDYLVFNKAIQWYKIVNNEKVIIEKVVESENKEIKKVDLVTTVQPQHQTQEPQVILYGGGIFVEDSSGSVYPKNIEIYSKCVGCNDAPKWFYKTTDSWIPINNNKDVLIIENNDPVLLSHKHVTYKVEYGDKLYSIISTSLVSKTTNVVTKENSVVVAPKHMDGLFIKANNSNEADFTIGGEKVTVGDNDDTILITNLKHFSDNYIDSYSKTIYVCSDRICKDDLPLTSKLDIGTNYILSTELDVDLMCVNLLSDVKYEIATNVISGKEVVTNDSTHGVIKVDDYGNKKVYISIPFTATDKTLRLGLDINLTTQQKGKNISTTIKVQDIRIDKHTQHFNIGGYGLQYVKNSNNFFCIENAKDGLVIDFKSTSKTTSILPIMAYGSISNKGIECIQGRDSMGISGAWSSIKDGYLFRFNFTKDTAKKYIISIINTSNIIFNHTINKMGKYVEVELKCHAQPSFDFIIYDLP